MKVLATLILWCILLALCWPLAVLVLVLFPVVWLVALPFRLVWMVTEAFLALIKGLLFLPARLVGYK